MNNLGSCYAMKKSYPYALKFFKQAVKSYNECEDEDVSNLLNNIALIYLRCQMFKQAEAYFKDAIQERKLKSPNNKHMLYNSYYNLGVCQKKMKKLEESLNNLVIAWNYAFEGHGKKIDVLTEICQVYEIQGKWSEALNHYEKLSEEFEGLGKPQGIIY
jgi:tetratricopeptide (TPR) repeat protein